MLLAVEGGGFFSSSASGYSKGLALLLLGQKNEEKPMRLSPWNIQYHLVDQEPKPDPNLQLASKKNRLSRGCASFICFSRSAAGLDTSSPLKVGPTQQQQQEILSGPHVSDKGKDPTHSEESNDECDLRKSVRKSNLKKHTRIISEAVEVVDKQEGLCENSDNTGRRSVQWTDTTGGELVEIREFEPSDVGGSDDEFDDENKRRCSCRIM